MDNNEVARMCPRLAVMVDPAACASVSPRQSASLVLANHSKYWKLFTV